MHSKKSAIDYYDQTHVDYRLLWQVDRTLSMHFGYYDRNVKTHDAAVINMNKVLAKKVKINSNDVVLDAGCGIGGSAIWLAKTFGCKVIGITLSEKQAFRAKELSKRNNVEDLAHFFIRDFTNTKFPNYSFDVVWAIESVCHAKNKKDFLAEAHRILKKGGRLIVADGFLKKENLTHVEKNYMDKWLDGWAVPNLASISEFDNYTKKLGFKNIKFADITKNAMPSSIHLYVAGFLGYPLGKFLELISIRTKLQTKNMIAAYNQYNQYITLKEGLWAYGVFNAEKGTKSS